MEGRRKLAAPHGFYAATLCFAQARFLHDIARGRKLLPLLVFDREGTPIPCCDF
jgi:hypothetical protein